MGKVVFAEIIGRFCHVAWEESLPSFSPCELERLPVSLSNATGMFEYSGQEVKNALPHLLCSLSHMVLSAPRAFDSYARV